jgi:hypothetical protein
LSDNVKSPLAWLVPAAAAAGLACCVLGIAGLLMPVSLFGAAGFSALGAVLALKWVTGRGPATGGRFEERYGGSARDWYETAVKLTYAHRCSAGKMRAVLGKTDDMATIHERLVAGLRGLDPGDSNCLLSPDPHASWDKRKETWLPGGRGRSVGSMLEEVASSVREMAVVLGDVDHHAKELISSTEDTSYSMSRLDSFLQDMATKGRDLESSTDAANRVALEGAKVVEEMGRENEAIISTVNEAATAVEDLGRWSHEVGKIVEVIRDIADETNLLALNAAIIAAQAGEQGKPFGVVSEEIRGLAERTSSSTKEISDLVKAVQENVAKVVDGMKRSLQRVERGELLTRNAGNVLEKVFESFESSRNLAKHIADSTFEHKIDSSQVVRSLQRVTDIARRLQGHDFSGWAGVGETLGLARALGSLGEAPAPEGEARSHGLDEPGGPGRPGEAMGRDLEDLARELNHIKQVLAAHLDDLRLWGRPTPEDATEVAGEPGGVRPCYEITACDDGLRQTCPALRKEAGPVFFSGEAACLGGEAGGGPSTAANESGSEGTTKVDRVRDRVGMGR